MITLPPDSGSIPARSATVTTAFRMQHLVVIPGLFQILRRFLPWLIVAALLATGGASAQTPRDPRAQLEATRLELNQIDAALQRDGLTDQRLGELRHRLEGLAAGVEEIIQREQPRADEIKARIEQLGPAPDAAKGQTESPEVGRDRADQQRAWQEADETLRLSRALALRITQQRDAIADRRRANFARQILTQGASIISPLLWLDVTKALPADLRAMQVFFQQWAETTIQALDWYEGIVLLLLLGVAITGLPRARHWVRHGTFVPDEVEEEPIAEPTRLSKALFALRRIILIAIAPAAFFYFLHWLFQNFGLLPARADAIMEAVFGGLAYIVGVSGLAAAVLSPLRPEWRLYPLTDHMAVAFWRTARLATAIVMVGRVAEALEGATVSALPVTIATKGTFAILVALAIARGLRQAFAAEANDDPEGAGGAPPAGPKALRLFGWTAIALVIGATLFGFVSFASFLVGQLLWLLILGLAALITLALIDEAVGTGLSARGIFGRRVQEATGVNPASLDQLSVLGAGLARLILFVAFGMLVLAPWGIDSSNLPGNLRAAFFGFQVGGVTISLATIALALGLFGVGFAVTRAIQNWLDTHYLPRTSLDPGLRNSIRTIFGYIGVTLAAILALGQLGISLDKLTIVAGALSVGIGFGLRSIVENFVSGLILLWERPIRVGDWIVVGDEQGKVKRINVRATEIETFDRASLIIPNAEFISGRVKNWMHADRMGRIRIPVSVDYSADPVAVEALLKDAALAHREILSEPKPTVTFKNLGESGLDFELLCFADVDAMAPTRSELLFDIFRRLKEQKIDIPYPTRRLEITNLAGGKIDLLASERVEPDRR